MNRLEETDRLRLAKLLGMLGSAHAGERDAAGLAAHCFLREHNLTWPELLCAPASKRRPSVCCTWHHTVDACLRHPGDLSPWESRFLRGLPRFPRLSPKQRACLDRIADRVLGSAAA